VLPKNLFKIKENDVSRHYAIFAASGLSPE
jgi:hypothetical protein